MLVDRSVTKSTLWTNSAMMLGFCDFVHDFGRKFVRQKSGLLNDGVFDGDESHGITICQKITRKKKKTIAKDPFLNGWRWLNNRVLCKKIGSSSN